MQNLVFLMEPSDMPFGISLQAGNMCLNHFCIDEDAATEISGVHYLQKSPVEIQFDQYWNDETLVTRLLSADLLPRNKNAGTRVNRTEPLKGMGDSTSQFRLLK